MYISIVLIFLIVYEVVSLSSAQVCPKDFQCGNFGNLSFPFSNYSQPNCGLITANCSNQTSPMVSINQEMERWFELLQSSLHGNSIRVLDIQLDNLLKQQMCEAFMPFIQLPNTSSISFTIEPNITLLKCLNDVSNYSEIKNLKNLSLYNICHDFSIYYTNPKYGDYPSYNIGIFQTNCTTITFPMAPMESITRNSYLFDLLSAEFDLSWDLSDKCGECVKVQGNRCSTDHVGSFVCATAKHENTRKWILVSVVSVITFVLVALLCYVMIQRCILKGNERRRRDDVIHQLTYSDSFNYGDELEKDIKDAPDIKIFSFKAILTATTSFSDENELGHGGYGPVYKGKLFDGREIAVKRLSKSSAQGIQEFKCELILISKLQHTNLVRLYGCCIYREEKMLIYEFMRNKSLDFFLFAEHEKKKINWQMRFNIIEGIAQGLLYLHKYSRMRVIHRDLKASNILLDENMNPKISDFGLAKMIQSNVTEGMTHRIVGTYGYIAPEYAMRGTFSTKSDIFSFGVLILEIVSGKKNSSFYNYDRVHNLAGYAWDLWRRDSALQLKDESFGESYDVKELLRAIHVGLLCVQENAGDRPNMSKIIYMLNNETVDIPDPKQPAFFIDTKPNENGLVEKNIPSSVNGLTLTVMGPR